MKPISWPTEMQTWVDAPVTIPGLAAIYDAQIQLGRAEHFHDGWLVSVDEPTITQILHDLRSEAEFSTRLATVGWTLRRPDDRPVELIDADGTADDLDVVDGRWYLPRHCGIQIAGQLPPLAQLYRSMALLEVYAYGPTDQYVKAGELSEAVGTVAAILGSFAGIVLGQTLDADNATVQQILTSLTGLLRIDLTAPATAQTTLTRLSENHLRAAADPQITAALRAAAVSYLSGAARVLPQYLLPCAVNAQAGDGDNTTDDALVRYDPHAARRWLADGAADEHGIDDGFCTHDLTIVAGLEDLLLTLSDGDAPDVWTTSTHLQRVQIWRTADGDGIDGGGLITADLSINSETIRIATRHQSFDQFTEDAETYGIDAAVEALAHVANLVNREGALVARMRRVTTSDRG